MSERTVPAERVETTDSEQAVDEPFPGAQSHATSAGAAAPTTNADRPTELPVASETSAAALDPNWRCKCGRPSTRWPGKFCDAHHTITGTPGAALQDGLGAEHLPEADDVPSGAYTNHFADLLRRHVSRLSRFLDNHPPRLADLSHVERMLVLVEKVKAFETRELSTAAANDGDTDAPYDAIEFSRKLARFYANEPDAFAAFIVTLVEADRERVGPLRQQLRLTLDALEPDGKPVWRADPNEADEVVL